MSAETSLWQVIFDGIGTEIISLVIGLITGGAVGYKIGVHNRIKQSQRAGDHANQVQAGSVTVTYAGKTDSKSGR